jgi:surface antigen
LAALILCGVAGGLGGCSYKLGSMFESSAPSASAAGDASDVTGSIRNARAEQVPGDVDAVPESDLAYARAAAVDVVSRGRNDVSQSWENPKTGARGTVTPLSSATTRTGMACRDFLASYVLERKEAWWQGEACEQAKGRWEIHSMKPWKRG